MERKSRYEIKNHFQKSMNYKEPSGLAYCFCKNDTGVDSINPCDINVLTDWNRTTKKQDNQTFYCHIECFKCVLHETIRGYLIIPTLDDEDE
jgi:hypothetical protein